MDVLNYQVVAKKSSQGNALTWLNTEAAHPFDFEPQGETVTFKFADLQDAFRFRLSFDEAILTA